jgi:hypothetical protein
MNRLRTWLDDTLWGPETAARLVAVHVGLSALIGVRIVAGPYHRLAGTPDALVDPVPFLGWLHGMPSTRVFVALQVVGGVAALAAVLRRHPRLAFAVAWLCYLVLAGLRGSRGKVLHNDLLLLWVSSPFLLAPIGVDLRDRIARRGYGWPVRVATVIMTLIYLFAGYHKLRRSGLDWAFGDNMRYVMLWGPSIGHTPWDRAELPAGAGVQAGAALDRPRRRRAPLRDVAAARARLLGVGADGPAGPHRLAGGRRADAGLAGGTAGRHQRRRRPPDGARAGPGPRSRRPLSGSGRRHDSDSRGGVTTWSRWGSWSGSCWPPGCGC